MPNRKEEELRDWKLLQEAFESLYDEKEAEFYPKLDIFEKIASLEKEENKDIDNLVDLFDEEETPILDSPTEHLISKASIVETLEGEDTKYVPAKFKFGELNNSFNPISRASKVKEADIPPIPTQLSPQMVVPSKGTEIETEELKPFPRFAIGDFVYNKNNKERGVVIDIARSSKMYIVKWDSKPYPEIADDSILGTELEVLRPMSFRPISEQEKAFMGQEGYQMKENENTLSIDMVNILKEVLTDPYVAQLIVTKLLEKGNIPVSDIATFLKLSGENALSILNNIRKQSSIDPKVISQLLKEVIKGG